MFLKSITLHGFLNVQDTQTINFDYKKNSEDSTDDIFINFLTNLDFIDGFSFIFDPKHSSNYNFNEFIHPKAKDNSYVEIHFWRSRDDVSKNYDWLCMKELKFRRTLQDPKHIFINKKKYDAISIQISLRELGVESINNINIHRLMDLEIGKLCSLNGTDFWDMLMKIIECEELIEMAERKEGVVRKQLIRERYNTIANSITNQLTMKYQICDEIRERIKVNRKFFTLFYILTERRISVITAYKDLYGNEEEKIVKEVRDMLHERLSVQKQKQIDLEEMISERTYVKSLKSTIDDLNSVIFNLNDNENDYLPIKKCLELINFCKFKEIDKTLVIQSMVAAFKIYLKDVKQNGSLDFEVKRWKNYLKDAAQLEVFEEFEDEFVDLDFTKIHEKEMTEKSTELIAKLLELKKQLLKFSSNAHILAIRGSFESSLPSTIFEIEKIIKNNPEFSENYMGPVFKYLNNDTNLDTKIWHQIKEMANFILFRKSEVANRFIKEFREKAAKNGGDPLKIIPNYRFRVCCIDDVATDTIYDNQIHDNETFMSLRVLISKSAPSSIKKVLETLFHEFLVVKVDEWELSDSVKNFKIIELQDNEMLKIHSKKYVQVVNYSRDFWDKLGRGPLSVIQEMYDQIIQQVKIALEIDQMEKLRNELDTILQFERREVVENYIKDVFSLKKKPSVFSVLSEVLENPNLSIEVDSWNVNELRKKINTEMFKLQINNDDFDDEYRDLYECFKQIRKDEDHVKEDIADALIKLPKSFALDKNLKIREILVNKRDELQNFLENSQSKSIDLHKIESLPNFLINPIDDPKNYCKNITNYRQIVIKKIELEELIKKLNKTLEVAHQEEFSAMFFHQDTYDKYSQRDTDELIRDFLEHRQKLIELNKQRMIDLRRLNLVDYQKMIKSIGNVKKFAEDDDFVPLKIKNCAYPLMNVIAVKILKDTISNFTTTYNYVFDDYLKNADLFFFTNPDNGIDQDNFSWDCFDLARLKAIEFVECWKNDKMRDDIDSMKLQRIKGLLLILFIINYMSAFKFLIISEKIFEGLNDDLVQKIRDALEAVSAYVQVIIYKKNESNHESNHEIVATQSEADPMDVDNDAILDDVSVIS